MSTTPSWAEGGIGLDGAMAFLALGLASSKYCERMWFEGDIEMSVSVSSKQVFHAIFYLPVRTHLCLF